MAHPDFPDLWKLFVDGWKNLSRALLLTAKAESHAGSSDDKARAGVAWVDPMPYWYRMGFAINDLRGSLSNLCKYIHLG